MRRSILLLLCLITLPLRAYSACECPTHTIDEQKEAATYVFSGTVADSGTDRKTGERRVSFDVNETFKGDPGTEIDLVDAGGADCALDVHEGENWIVYARWQWGAKATSSCWGTKKVEHASKDATALGPADSWKAKQYPKLRDACMGHRDVGCCLNSVKTMAARGYLPEPEEGCAAGTIPDRLTCPTSYTWCIPIVESEKRHSTEKSRR